MEYLIQGETMTAIANQVRRLAGTSEPLSPAQMAAALNYVSAGGTNDDCDSIRFFDFGNNAIRTLGNNGYDSNGNALTPLTALPYLKKYMCDSASSAYDYNLVESIVGKFNPSIQHEFVNYQYDVIAEIRAPSCISIDSYTFGITDNLVSAYFPSCMSLADSAFYGGRFFESLTLNSGCDIDSWALAYVISPGEKTFRLYLRGSTVGTCDESVFGEYAGIASTYANIQELYDGAVPGLEIYVPSNLLTDFKTTWANGTLADNIYPLPY